MVAVTLQTPRPTKGEFPRVEEITVLSVHKSSLLLSWALPLSIVKSVAKIYQVFTATV